jgi:hypothetical protein
MVTAKRKHNPPKIGPPVWLPLVEEAFQQMYACSRSSRKAAKDLYDILRSGDCPSIWVSPAGAECPLSTEWWGDVGHLVVPPIERDGGYRLEIRYPDYAFDHIDYLCGRGTFFVLATAFARALELLYPKVLYPTPAAAPAVVQAVSVPAEGVKADEPAAASSTPAPEQIRPPTPRVWLAIQALDAQDKVFHGLPAEEQLGRIRRWVKRQPDSSKVNVGERTLRKAKKYRRKHPK